MSSLVQHGNNGNHTLASTFSLPAPQTLFPSRTCRKCHFLSFSSSFWHTYLPRDPPHLIPFSLSHKPTAVEPRKTRLFHGVQLLLFSPVFASAFCQGPESKIFSNCGDSPQGHSADFHPSGFSRLSWVQTHTGGINQPSACPRNNACHHSRRR